MHQSNFIVGIMKIRVIIVFSYIIFYSIILVFGTIQECNFWSKFSKCDRSFRGPIIYFIEGRYPSRHIYRGFAFHKYLIMEYFQTKCYIPKMRIVKNTTSLWEASMVYFLQGNDLLRHLDKYITSIYVLIQTLD